MSVLVGNTTGSFALFGIESRYQGVFFWLKKEMFRVVADIVRPGRVSGESYELWRGLRTRNRAKEAWWFANGLPVFFYECNKPSEVLLDVKKNFDNREWGREYSFEQEKGTLIVHFRKRNDAREPGQGEYEVWAAFHGASFEVVNGWVEQRYRYDEQRKSPPASRWVLRALNAGGSFVMACALSRDDAVKLARQSWERKQRLAREAEQHASALESRAKRARAESYARYSLQCLEENHGLFAGLPWFHQRWARDELISVKGLLLANKVTLAKSIVFHWLSKVSDGGLPGTMTDRIADGAWVFVRCEDLLPVLSAKERALVLRKAGRFVDAIEKRLDNGLVVNGKKETWMDSVDRDGARIEVQALALAACRLLRVLGKPHSLEQELAEEAQAWFWTGAFVRDGINDDAMRPNVFLAAYVYPELFAPEQWEQCFDVILPRLWCEWGGLASLDKDHECFVGEHTGENPASYHCGDSWFWVNNLAAIVLYRLNREKYKKYIEAITKASVKDILEGGVTGHASEVSSAKEQRAEGSPVQAWSAATLLELLAELKSQNS